jgi:MoaA/NifB/PqqE/SkfB family radical SAM enzyme
MTKIDLKNYVCTAPFRFLHVHEENQYFLCIPEWLIKRNPLNQPLSEIWNSEDALESRRSVMDVTFRHCDATQCPYLSYLLKFNEVDPKGPIYHKDNLPSNIKEKFLSQDPYMEVGPEKIEHNFDKSCNYKCPSCRKETYKATQEKLVEVENTMEEMKRLFSKDAKTLYFTASGDPFVSNTFRTFLQNFNKEEYDLFNDMYPEEFVIQIQNISEKLASNYVNSIERIVYYTDNIDSLGKDYQKHIEDYISEKNEDWIKKYKPRRIDKKWIL